MKPATLYSWNVNGLKAILRKHFSEFIADYDPEVLCLQETKAQDAEAQRLLSDFTAYYLYHFGAERKGYSGTAILTQRAPKDVYYGIGQAAYDEEGRVITLVFPDYYLVNAYVPNAGSGLKRLDFREQWDQDFRNYLNRLAAQKPVVVTGDFNVAHEEIDIARPKQNYNKSAGFTQTEIDGFEAHLDQGLVDTFRSLYPDQEVYSYWSYRANARERNVGWRIDYFLVSQELWPKVKDAYMLNEVQGSDHCPVVLNFK